MILAFTKNFLPGAHGLTRSLIKNMPNHKLSFKVFHKGLDDVDKDSLRQIVRHIEFFPIVATRDHPFVWWFQAFNPRHRFVQTFAYTLYIDVDMIVNRPLDDLLEHFDKSECKILGVNQKSPHKDYQVHRKDKHLINTGFVLFKRSFFTTPLYSDFQYRIQTMDREISDDQPFLRNFFRDNNVSVLYAPHSYNINANMLKKDSNPHIYHFVGPVKPWKHRPNRKISKERILWLSLLAKHA